MHACGEMCVLADVFLCGCVYGTQVGLCSCVGAWYTANAHLQSKFFGCLSPTHCPLSPFPSPSPVCCPFPSPSSPTPFACVYRLLRQPLLLVTVPSGRTQMNLTYQTPARTTWMQPREYFICTIHQKSLVFTFDIERLWTDLLYYILYDMDSIVSAQLANISACAGQSFTLLQFFARVYSTYMGLSRNT